MAEPSRRASRLTIALATLALIAAGAAGFALGRESARSADTVPAASPPVPAAPPKPIAVLPADQPPLARSELIAAAARAADAIAAGQGLPKEVTELAGREFDLRLPFGCPGAPATGSPVLSAEYDESAEALRVRAEPVSWAPEEWLTSPPGGGEAAESVDAIEGFWIARPWTSSEACPPATPAPPAGQAEPAEAEQTLGIAQIFTAESSRVGRRDGEAYQAVEPVAAGALDVSRGLQLRLRGKLARAPGGAPILCRAASGTRPACLVIVALDQVAIENPATGAALATWDVSSQSRVSR